MLCDAYQPGHGRARPHIGHAMRRPDIAAGAADTHLWREKPPPRNRNAMDISGQSPYSRRRKPATRQRGGFVWDGGYDAIPAGPIAQVYPNLSGEDATPN
ncbi:hypothetical protein GCM10011505_30110 [Tistrella bauzanensis]|uniref:Uncharacterized protein n=1 Tax=Tistrella bauzanensis TaxID=657419 RepID=A0ABQ1INS5_9PROT|nr:hypothetical protein GCM10011505_30110 [Tistrella bauzanensis]